MTRITLQDRWHRLPDDARLRLAHPDALLHLARLGLLSGLAAGGVILPFRLLVEGSQSLILPGDGPENHEGLPWWARLLMPIGGGPAIGLLFRMTVNGGYVPGATMVLERMAYHQGRMQWRGFFLQFTAPPSPSSAVTQWAAKAPMSTSAPPAAACWDRS